MDIFGDAILRSPDSRRAKAELEEIAKIEAGDAEPKDKCVAVWRLKSSSNLNRAPD